MDICTSQLQLLNVVGLKEYNETISLPGTNASSTLDSYSKENLLFQLCFLLTMPWMGKFFFSETISINNFITLSSWNYQYLIDYFKKTYTSTFNLHTARLTKISFRFPHQMILETLIYNFIHKDDYHISTDRKVQ